MFWSHGCKIEGPLNCNLLLYLRFYWIPGKQYRYLQNLKLKNITIILISTLTIYHPMCKHPKENVHGSAWNPLPVGKRTHWHCCSGSVQSSVLSRLHVSHHHGRYNPALQRIPSPQIWWAVLWKTENPIIFFSGNFVNLTINCTCLKHAETMR